MTFTPEALTLMVVFPSLLLPPDLSLELQTHFGHAHLGGADVSQIHCIRTKKARTKKHKTDFKQES